MLAANDVDLILTTELTPDPGAELLCELPLCFYCLAGSEVWKQRPLKVANEPNCIFRPFVLDSLNRANISWDIPFSGTDWREFAAFFSAGMAVSAVLEGAHERGWEVVPAQADLPALPVFGIYLYLNEGGHVKLAAHMAGYIRDAFCRQSACAIA